MGVNHDRCCYLSIKLLGAVLQTLSPTPSPINQWTFVFLRRVVSGILSWTDCFLELIYDHDLDRERHYLGVTAIKSITLFSLPLASSF